MSLLPYWTMFRPCVYDVDLSKYAQMTKEITDFLNGEDKTILKV